MRIQFILGILCLAVSLAGCGKKEEPAAKEAAPVSVRLAMAEARSVPYVIESIGNVEAFNSVEVRPQVNGELTECYFTDGGMIQEGELLFTIDERAYAAALEESVGKREQAKAQLAYNRERVRRYEELRMQDFISELTYDQYVSEMVASEGQVEEYEGAVKSAEVNLGYCRVLAPISGRLGRNLIDPGNIVSIDQEQSLVVINQISPIYVTFSVAGRFFPEVQKYFGKSKILVDVSAVGEEKELFTGELNFVDNAIDTKTGRLLLRAQLPNLEEKLWPGQFAKVRVRLYEIPDAVLVPEEAVKRDAKGPYVFVAKADQTVEQKRVTLGQLLEGKWVISEGLSGGEKVVTDGQLSLSPGTKILVEDKK